MKGCTAAAWVGWAMCHAALKCKPVVDLLGECEMLKQDGERLKERGERGRSVKLAKPNVVLPRVQGLQSHARLTPVSQTQHGVMECSLATSIAAQLWSSIERQSECQTLRHTDTETKTHGQTERQTDRQTDTQTERDRALSIQTKRPNSPPKQR